MEVLLPIVVDHPHRFSDEASLLRLYLEKFGLNANIIGADGIAGLRRLKPHEVKIPAFLVCSNSEMLHMVLQDVIEGRFSSAKQLIISPSEICETVTKIGESVSLWSSTSSVLVRDCTRMIYQHLADMSFTVYHIAAELSISRRKLEMEFSRSEGIAVGRYIQRVRMAEAQRLLTDTRMTVGEIGYSMGYNDVGSFSRAFSRHYGHPPSVSRNIVCVKS